MSSDGIQWICRSRRLQRHPALQARARQLGAHVRLTREAAPAANSTFIGWGYKPSGQWARDRASCQPNASVLHFEDSFVRSLRPGDGSGAVYGLVEDRAGIYYDPEGCSDLTGLVECAGKGHVDSDVHALMRRFRALGASKYNWYPDVYRADAADEHMPDSGGVLVVDQSRGDASLQGSGIDANTFRNMLEAALDENEGKRVYVRSHPDHLYRRRLSCMPRDLLQDERVTVVPATLAPRQVFERVEKVYAVNSLLGMEALIHEKPLVCFGPAFYSGWGLTDDRGVRLPGRARACSLAGLFDAAYTRYSRYFDPDTGEPCSLMRILDHLALQQRCFRENARQHWVVSGMSPWKKPIMRQFLGGPASRVSWAHTRRGAERLVASDPRAMQVAWGCRGGDRAPVTPRLIAEDGFVRSRGLGANFTMPLSLVFDPIGIYYNAQEPSALEQDLREHDCSAAETVEARDLIDALRQQAITKYNLTGAGQAAGWPGTGSQHRILVPGQVESDASIQYGAESVKTNLELLRAVRAAQPDAVIAYKPHPDIAMNLRRGGTDEAAMREHCDIIVTDIDILPWLTTCHAIHTMTSLSGFEGLIREKQVHCYGLPFYAGWGLTVDAVPAPRRGRTLTLEELVVAALIRYPRYLNPLTSEFTNALGAVAIIREGVSVHARSRFLRGIAALKRSCLAALPAKTQGVA
jgi:capsular polysaccharide export protein